MSLLNERMSSGLKVGVTGHRPNRLVDIDDTALRQSIREALTAIVNGTPGYQRTVISPLAEGADRMVAWEALNAGYRLVCPLPFSREEYARDFTTVDSHAEYSALLSQADTVVELPGTRDTPDCTDAAYAAVGRHIVSRSDLLIAVWDGHRARGDGGTADVVAAALANRMPVIWIATQPPSRVRVITREGTIARNGADLSSLPSLIARRIRIRDDRHLTS